MTDELSAFTGSIPQYYDQGLGPHIFNDYAMDIAARVAALQPANVLELAAGTGIVSRHLRYVLPEDVPLTATDLNEPMLVVAKRKFGPDEAITFAPANACELPFDDGAFDCVACQFGIMFFPDKDLSYREALRVLRPGGSYIFSVWDSMDVNPFARIADNTITGFFDSDPPQFYKLPFHYHDREAIVEALHRAGFTNVTVTDLSLEKEIPSTSLFAEGLVHGNPVAVELKERSSATADEVVEAVAAALKAEFGDPGTMPLQSIMFEAKKD